MKYVLLFVIIRSIQKGVLTWSDVLLYKSLQKVASFCLLESYWNLLIILSFRMCLDIWKGFEINFLKILICVGLKVYILNLLRWRVISRKRVSLWSLRQSTCFMGMPLLTYKHRLLSKLLLLGLNILQPAKRK